MSGDTTQVQVRKTYERCFSAGSVIFDEGDPGDTLFVIQAGEVQLSRSSQGGRQSLGRLSAGEFFGEMGVVVREPRRLRAVAVSECRLLQIDGETLEAMCMAQPEVAIRIIRRLTDRLLESERRLAALGVDDLLRPVVRALVRLGAPEKDAFRIPATLRRLATESGLTMLEAHRALHQLLDQKLVKLVDDELVAPDLDRLSACLDSPH